MKIKFLISAFLGLAGFIATQGQNVNIPDPNFKAYLIGNSSINTNGDNEISIAEAQALFGSIICNNRNITDLTGIEAFMNITGLECKNNQLSSLDVSNNTALKYLNCDKNPLSSLDLSNNTALYFLHCGNNQLSSLDLSNNTALTELYCYSNQLSSLDLSNNTALIHLYCHNNQLSSLDVSNNTALINLYCDGNQLSSLDISNNTALINLACNNNQLNILDISNNTVLKFFYCNNNQLSSLDVSNNTALTDLRCNNNKLSSLDVSNNTALVTLICDRNQLSSLDVSNNTALVTLICDRNQLSSLDVSNNTALEWLICGFNPLGSLDVSNNTALTSLRCYNNQLSSLDISNNTALTQLWCYNNQLSSLDVSNNTNLYDLHCYNNQLSSLVLSNNTALYQLYCYNNQLSSLDVSNNTALTSLRCYNNQLSSLDLSNNTALVYLWCNDNQLSSLNLKNGNNTNIYAGNGFYFNLTNNPDLRCIQVDDVAYSNANWSDKKDATACFSEDCVTPTFDLPTKVCQNATQTLPTISSNTILGTWSPSTIDTSVAGTQTYTFIPTTCAKTFNAGQTLADLNVNGNNLVWYSDQGLTTTIPNTTALVHNTTYYVIEQDGNCQSDALAITVTDCATLVSQPIGATTQSFNVGQTIDDLVVNGNNLVWYSDQGLTTTIPNTTELVHNTTYYVVEQDGDCRSAVLAITVTDCATLVSQPIGDANQTFNAGQTLADLVVNENNLVWYSDQGLTTTIPNTTALVHNTTYYVVEQDGNCQSAALVITVTDCATLVSQPTGEANQTFSAGQTLADLNVNGNNLVWYSDQGLTTTIPNTTALVHNTTYYVIEQDGNCKSAVLAIMVTDCATLVSQPTGEANQTFNAGQTIDDLVVNGSNLVWYSDQGLTTTIPNTTVLVHNTTYYVVEQDGDCRSAVLTITVTDCATLVSQPTGEANQTFSAGQTLADLVVNGNNLVWYSDFALTTEIPDTTALVHNTTYYVVEQDGDCKSVDLAITVTDCATLVSQPTGATTQTFNAGQTIDDLVVNGSNLVWYSDNTYSNALSLNEPLVDGATYYIVSEVDNCQSEALAITVEEQANRTNFDVFGFTYYPNPTSDVLYFSSNQPIENITFSNMLGQTINLNLSSEKTSVDLSNLPSGNYFVKVSIEGVSKTIKIVKQ